MILQTKLEEQTREELLSTVRHILVEAEALSSRIVAVNEIGIAINRTLDIDEILGVVARQAKWLLDFKHCSVCMRTMINYKWTIKTLFGDELTFENQDALMKSAIGFVVQRGQSRLLNDDSESGFMLQYPSKIIIPLTSESEVIGTINFASATVYSHDDMRIGYLLALQLASAIRNAERVQMLKTVQSQLEEYARELVEQNQELDAYSHTIAHDLKSPLSVIPLKAGLVKMYSKDLPPEATKHLDDIVARSKHMAEMIDQLLLLSKLRHKDETLTRVNVNAVINRCVTRFPQVELGQINITVQEDLPQVMGHSQWVEEVFANLISNAIKYMGNNNEKPSITIRAVRIDKMVARFEVQDNGIGIRTEDQKRLFTMFTRLNDIQTEGLGLGLSIVHRIVDRLGGKLGVDSEWGKGTTFWFTMPSF